MSRKAVFLDRDGVINVEKNFILSPEQIELIEEVPEAVKLINESQFLAILFTNQSAVARNLINIDELAGIHQKLELDLQKFGAYLDAVYVCPHHPGFDISGGNSEFLIECECRKPKAGMLFQAANDLNINLNQSFVVGDTDRDIKAGKEAGCTAIGVRTGKNIETFDITPDYVFDNLQAAIQFILNDS
ncbi:MAG: HAD-IIIA family hydrolase [Bacteroidales bacterium]